GSNTSAVLGSKVREIGLTLKSGQDGVFFAPQSAFETRGLTGSVMRVVIGEDVRDFGLDLTYETIFPYSADGSLAELESGAYRFLWRSRRALETQIDFGKTKAERGRQWYEPSMFFGSRYAVPFSITFAFVATHNHFVLDRGGKAFNR